MKPVLRVEENTRGAGHSCVTSWLVGIRFPSISFAKSKYDVMLSWLVLIWGILFCFLQAHVLNLMVNSQL